jgi:hypothetical protein
MNFRGTMIPFHLFKPITWLNYRRRLTLLYALICLFLAGSLTSCDGEIPDLEDFPEDDLKTIIAASITAADQDSQDTIEQPPETVQPLTTPTDLPAPTSTTSPTPQSTPTLPPFNVSGKICFPDGSVPAMTVFFEETETETLIELAIAEGQTFYEIALDSGVYIAYAWLSDFSRGGLYSRAVTCGLVPNCTDHSLQAFTVDRARILPDINLCDWHPGPFNVPYPPGKSPNEITGNITGMLSYPDEIPPGLRVVAFNLNTKYWYWVSTMAQQDRYTITDLPAGKYHIVAYDAEGRAGAYADENHQLIEVEVKAGEMTGGVDILDWQAPTGSFPPDPTRE